MWRLALFSRQLSRAPEAVRPLSLSSFLAADAKDQGEMAYVMRQDENKTRYTMARVPLKEAEALVAKYRSTSHKQTYWIETDKGQTPPPAAPHRPPQERPPLENPMKASNPFGAMLFDAKKGPPRKI